MSKFQLGQMFSISGSGTVNECALLPLFAGSQRFSRAINWESRVKSVINLKSMSIYADYNSVIGNAFIDTNLEAKSGDALFPELLQKNAKYQGAHPAARHTLVVGNQFVSGKIRLGRKGTGKKEFDRSFPAENTVLILNRGASVVREGPVKGTETRTRYDDRIGEPMRMMPSQVGPHAADPVCDGRTIPLALLPPDNLSVVTTRF